MFELQLNNSSSNALNREFMLELIDQIHEAKTQPILISSKAKTFSVGADLKEIVSMDANQIVEYIGIMEKLFITLLKHPAPTVAAVSGHAVGGGSLIFLCCDFAYCEDRQDILVGMPEVASGVLISPILMKIFKQLVEATALRKLILSAKLIDPQKALAYGLFDAIGSDVMSLASRQLAYLSSLPKEVYATTKADLLFQVSDQKAFEQQIHTIVSSGALSGYLSAKFG